jgi:hypothetical protein
MYEKRSLYRQTTHLRFSVFLRKKTLLIPPMSLRLMRLLDLDDAPAILTRRLCGSPALAPEALLGLGETVPGLLEPVLLTVLGLDPKYEDTRRPLGVGEVTVVVVVVVVVLVALVGP